MHTVSYRARLQVAGTVITFRVTAYHSYRPNPDESLVEERSPRPSVRTSPEGATRPERAGGGRRWAAPLRRLIPMGLMLKTVRRPSANSSGDGISGFVRLLRMPERRRYSRRLRAGLRRHRAVSGLSVLILKRCIENGSKYDEAEEASIKLPESGKDAAKSLRSPEQPFDFVTPLAHPRSYAQGQGRAPGGGTTGLNPDSATIRRVRYPRMPDPSIRATSPAVPPDKPMMCPRDAGRSITREAGKGNCPR